MEEKSNTSSEKDIVFTKRQVSFMYEYFYENDLIDECVNEENINYVAERILEECMQSEDNEGIIIDLEAMHILTPKYKDDCWNDLIEDADLGMDMKYSTGTTTASFDLVKKRIFEAVDRWL
tara:strand:- start:458 stop:820 length:363 start_codon:yes stop_codon:yes gene_type:complete